MTKTKEQIQKSEEQIYELRKSVRYDIRELVIENIVSKYEKGLDYTEDDENQDKSKFYNVLFIPEYQRDFTWDKIRQSRLIESVILGLPIPLIFVAENKDSAWEIVDGSQRIRTLHAFITNTLCLSGLEKFTTLNDFYFKDLDPSRQGKILNTSLRMIVLSEDADDEVKRDMFERINRGSDLLKPMEKRKGDKTGLFTQFIYERCSKIALLDKLAPIDKFLQKRQEKEELILRYFALSDKKNYLKFPKNSGIATFLDKYLDAKNKELASLKPQEVKKVLDNYFTDFTNVLNFVDKYSTYGFRKTYNPQTKRVLFEAISVGVHVALKQKPDLTFNKTDWNKMINAQSFKPFWAGSTKLHDAAKLKDRITFISNTLLTK
ncbi:DUF262 domain-containing protein [Chryseobacterium sp.]|uniref:DUF262 domain-containing protein n=1 Tax=Chryseobacterium sp. TaxID=1871047 RepID=UPI002FC9008F